MIIVTGAAGFIGSNIVAHLESEKRDEIVICDWFGSDSRWRNVAKRKIVHFITPETLLEFVRTNRKSVSAIIHMGAISSTTERNVDRLLSLNVAATLALWDVCAELEIRLVYASSAAVYGLTETKCVDDNSEVAQSLLRPLNPYGWSKKIVDQAFVGRAAAGLKSPPQWVGLRFFNVYGPNEYHKGSMKSVVAKLFDEAKETNIVQLFRSHRCDVGHGEQRRDFIYVGDCCKVVSWFLDHPDCSGIFNSGTGQSRSFLDVYNALTAMMEWRPCLEFVDTPEHIRDQYQYNTQADMSRSQGGGMDILYTALEDGVAEYVSKYLACEDRYR